MGLGGFVEFIGLAGRDVGSCSWENVKVQLS